jgi:TFIIF-interacting CTD phosphatase-like protein
VRAVNEKNSLVVDHINGSIRIIKECENYEIPSLSEMTDRKVLLKKNEYFKKKKTLVLDLDETLIHCVSNF